MCGSEFCKQSLDTSAFIACRSYIAFRDLSSNVNLLLFGAEYHNMTRGNARSRVNNPIDIDNHAQKTKAHNNVQSVQSIKKEIDHRWKVCMPQQAKMFLLEALDLPSLHKLARFWSSPSVIEYTRGVFAGNVCGASWLIALNYLKLGQVQEARALTLNGAFLNQCLVSIVAV